MIQWNPGQTRVSIEGVAVKLLGDPHIGRNYRNGVPLHRRGEREQMTRENFRRELEDTDGIDLHVCVGDIFDRFVVTPADVLFVGDTYATAAVDNPSVIFVLLRGNHDASRDVTLRSSFDILAELLRGLPNVVIVKDTPQCVFVSETGEDSGTPFGFIPWTPFDTSEEMAEQYLQAHDQAAAIFGHWDIDSYGGDDDNLVPTQKLSDVTSLIITGHVHQAQHFERDGVDVIVTGSMLPQAHGEELDDKLFVTLTLEDLDPEFVKDKCVRLRLREGEEIPKDLDCLQLVVQRVSKDNNPVDLDDVQVEAFDLQKLFDEAAAENDLRSPLIERVRGFVHEEMSAQE